MAAGAGLAAGQAASQMEPEQIEAITEGASDNMDKLLIAGAGIVGIGAVGYYLYVKSGMKAMNDLVKALSGGVDWVWGETTGFFDSAGNFISGGLDDIGSWFGDIGSGAGDFLGDIGSGTSDFFSDAGDTLKFWRLIYEDTTITVMDDGDVITGERAVMTYVFEDGTALVTEGQLKEENNMKIPSNVDKLIVEVPSEDIKDVLRFE